MINRSIWTLHFLFKKISDWFDVLNVKTPDKGKNLKNPLLNPIESIADPAVTFLREFNYWLLSQSSLRGKFLTCQTYKAARITTGSTIRCIETLLRKGMTGILTGVFKATLLKKDLAFTD